MMHRDRLGPARPQQADPLIGQGEHDQHRRHHGEVLNAIPRIAPREESGGHQDHQPPEDSPLSRVHGFRIHDQRAELLEDHYDDGQDDAHGAGIAHLLVQERLPDHEQRGHGGISCRPAVDAGQREDHARILDGVYDHEDEQQVDGPHDQRKFHLGELGPPAHPVDFRRLVDILRDTLQLRQVSQHGERADPREAPHDAGRDDQAGISQPRGHAAFDENPAPVEETVQPRQDIEEAGPEEEPVQVTRGRLEEERPPDQNDHESRDHHGDDEQRAIEELHALVATAMDRHGHEERGDHLDHIPRAEDERQLERVPEFRVLQQVNVVLQPAELGDVGSVPPEEAVEDPAARGVVLEETDQDHHRQDEQVDFPVMFDLAQLDGLRVHFSFLMRSLIFFKTAGLYS
ncbi:MAG: hypothetical protein BWY59_00218 [Verrucomicrobia bacterium ADurb.Bin345]|nr:MAG: hypothetical protein BWY59_00218 [Verrucomicrobia bacterium ADurb.Bin345]